MYKIMLIGEDMETALLTAKLIKRKGFEISVKANDSKMKDTKQDLLIFDCGLSPEQGFKKYQNIIESCHLSKIFWISSDFEDEVPALELGADDWMKRPINIEVLVARIRRLLKDTRFTY